MTNLQKIKESWRETKWYKMLLGVWHEGKTINGEVEDFWFQEIDHLLREKELAERQFILNVLDGIDMADKQMGNKGGGTKAIRLVLSSRALTPPSLK